jgi:hypothetical protein
MFFSRTANYASALAIELRRGPPPEDRDFLRFKFKNGTDGDFETRHVFGHRGDIPLTEFIYKIQVFYHPIFFLTLLVDSHVTERCYY